VLDRFPYSAGIVCKALVVLVGVTGCLAAVAYASGARFAGGPGIAVSRRVAVGGAIDLAGVPDRLRVPLRPRFRRRPPKRSLSAAARFRVAARGRQRNPGQPSLRFACRLDRGRWRHCRRHVMLRGLGPGRHVFRARAIDRRGRRGTPARYRWTIAAPRDFTVRAGATPPAPLYPGAPPSQVPLLVENPNPVPIFLTRLEVEVTAAPPGCDAATNLRTVPAGVSPAAPAVVPAGGSLSLPAAGVDAPALALRDLPVSQDACRGASFALAFHGSARG